MATLVDLKYNDDESTGSECYSINNSKNTQVFHFVTPGDTVSSYGSVYTIQQISVSLAYSLGPIFGGEMAQYFGFYWLMIIVGTLNIVYSLILLVLLTDWQSNVMRWHGGAE